MPPQQVVLFIIGTIAILFGAYYVTYFIGMKASGQTRAGLRNRSIAVLDNYSIARDKSFCVVRIAEKVYIMGITANGMTVLDTYDAEEYSELAENSDTGIQMPWSDTPVGRYGNKLTKSVVQFFGKRTGKLPKEEETPAAEDAKATFADAMKNAKDDDRIVPDGGEGVDDGCR